MKIALIHFNLTTESGDPKMVFSIAQELTRAGHTVVVYCAEFNAQTSFPRLNHGLDVRVVLPAVPLAMLRGATGAVAKVKERMAQIRVYNDLVDRIGRELEKDFDYLLCENDYSYKLGRSYKMIRPEAKVVWIMNNPQFFHSQKSNAVTDILSRCVAFFEKLSAKRYAQGIDWIVVYTEELKRLASVVGRPVKIIYNPIELAYFYKPVKHGVDLKGAIRLLGVGALSPQRRYEDILSAMMILRQRGYDARATLICKDFWGNKEYRQAFEAFVEKLGAKEYADIRFGGATEEEYLAAIRASDVFVLPNNIKIWGVGAFEGMAAGLPLVVSRVTAVAEILTDNKDALFVDALQPDQIAEKIEELAKNSDFYFSIASAGQKLVVDEMGLDSFARKVLQPPQPPVAVGG